MNTLERINKLVSDSNITEDMPYSEACAIISTVIQAKVAVSEKVISVFKELNIGEMYECPHCNGSHTLIEFGACHWCGEELAAPNTSLKQKSFTSVKSKDAVKEAASAAEPTPTEEKVEKKERKKRITKAEKAALDSEAENKKAATTVVESVKKATEAVNPVGGKYANNLPSLQAGLKQAKDPANKHTALCKLEKDFNLQLPRPDMTSASVLRAQIINELEKLIAACAKPETKAEKKGPKVVEIDESEIDFDDEELTLDEDEDDDTVVSSTDDEDEDDKAEEVKPKEKKKTAKKEEKKTSKKKVVDEDENENEIDFDDEEDEKPKKGKKQEASDEDEAFELDEEDEKLDAVELEDDEFDLIEDDEDIED